MIKYFNTNFKGLWKYLLFLAVVLATNALFTTFPSLCESVYTNGLFRVFRILYDYTLGWSPIPFVYFLFVFLLIRLWKTIMCFRNRGVIHCLNRLIKFVCIVIGLFYVLWGFNYCSPGLKQKLNLAKTEIDQDYLKKEIIHVNELMQNYRPKTWMYPENAESLIRSAQREILEDWNMSSIGRVRIRKLRPKGVLLRLSTAGIYIPYVLEGHIDRGLHSMQWPAIMAHEMAHGYGVTDEGTCNFIALVTCLKVKDESIKYSGLMLYLRYLLSNYRRAYKSDYGSMLSKIDSLIIADLEDIGNELKKYPDLMPKARDVIYDQYLKSHGVKDGLKSYSTIIQMVASWRESNWNSALKEEVNF